MSTVTAATRASAVFFLQLRRAGHSTLLIAFLNPLMVMAAMGLGLGSLVQERSAIGGVEYLSFLAPGLMAAVSMQSAAGASLWPVLGGFKWQGTFVAQATTPLRPVDVLLGRLTYTASDITIRVLMTFLAMVAFGVVESWTALLAPAVALLTGFVYAATITAFSATQEHDLAFPLIMRFGVIPSYLFSGVFFPVSQLPDVLEAVAKVTPLWHGVELCRALTLGNATLAGFAGHVAYLLVLAALAVAWGARTFERRLYE